MWLNRPKKAAKHCSFLLTLGGGNDYMQQTETHANSYMSELGSGSSNSSHILRNYSPCYQLDCSLVRDPEPRSQQALFVKLRTWETNSKVSTEIHSSKYRYPWKNNNREEDLLYWISRLNCKATVMRTVQYFYTNQKTNRIEQSPETDSHIYGHLTYYTGVNAEQWGTHGLSKRWFSVKWIATWKKVKLDLSYI